GTRSGGLGRSRRRRELLSACGALFPHRERRWAWTEQRRSTAADDAGRHGDDRAGAGGGRPVGAAADAAAEQRAGDPAERLSGSRVSSAGSRIARLKGGHSLGAPAERPALRTCEGALAPHISPMEGGPGCL